MIKPNELRIGNLVMAKAPYQKSPQVTTVDSVGEEGINLRIGNRGVDYDQCLDGDECDPIPLTPEWLERLGFDHTDEPSCECWEHDDIDFRIWRSRKEGWFDMCSFDVLISSFQYVHQLQNLFFTLTGEELTVKEVTNG